MVCDWDSGPPLDVLTDWSNDKQFAELLLEKGADGAVGELAALCRSCGAPGADFIASMMMTLCNIAIGLGAASLEPTGVLEEVFRTAVHPSADVRGPALQLLSLVGTDARLVRKKLRDGAPAGAALASAVAESRLGTNSEISKALLALQLQAQTSNQCTSLAGMRHLCRACSKEPEEGEKLLACSRCKTAHYCSKECQKSDWKTHKQICIASAVTHGSASSKRTPPADMKSSTNVVMNFVHLNILPIRARLRESARAARQINPSVKLRDFVLVVDFEGNTDPSDFSVGFSSALLARKPPFDLVSRWAFPGTEVFEENISAIMRQIAAVRDTLLEDMLLVVSRAPDGGTGVHRCKLRTADGTSLLSDADLERGEAAAFFEELRLGAYE
jgi:hypothetical protein